MIPLAEINQFSQKLKVPAETIEKDYVISWILYCLSKGKLKDNFIFYGGTAIKRVYFEEHRFSEDIDLLSDKKFSLDFIIDNLNLKHAKDEANLALSVSPDKTIQSSDRIQMYINYDGFEEIVGVPKEIRLDFSMDMDLFGQTNSKSIIETYSDLHGRKFNLPVMNLNTILANKLGLLLDRTRNEPRDLFDIWFLLSRLEQFDFDNDQFSKAFRDKYGFSFTSSLILNALQNINMGDKWEHRLGKQMPNLPEIKYIITDIRNKITLF